MNNEFVSVPRDPSDETLRAMLEVIRPATYRKHLRYPGAGEKTSQAEEADISIAKRQYAAVINSAQPAAQHQGDAIGTLARDADEKVVFTLIGDPHIKDGMPVFAEQKSDCDGGECGLGGYCGGCPKIKEQHQGEPVAWQCTESGSILRIDKAHGTHTIPLYTHADTGEVERLSEKCDHLTEANRILMDDCDTLRAERDGAIKLLGESVWKKIEDMRAQLAERDALLLSIYNTEPLAAETSRRIETALSASAEPSAQVERDERAAFEGDWARRKKSEGCRERVNAFYRIQPNDRYRWSDVQDGWEAWQARAVLERKS